MTDMKEQDAGLVVTCVNPLYCPCANEGNLGETIRRHSNYENFEFTHSTASLSYYWRNCETITLSSWIKQCDHLFYAAGWRRNSVFHFRQQYRANLWGGTNTSSIQYLITESCITLIFVKHITLSPLRKEE